MADDRRTLLSLWHEKLVVAGFQPVVHTGLKPATTAENRATLVDIRRTTEVRGIPTGSIMWLAKQE